MIDFWIMYMAAIVICLILTAFLVFGVKYINKLWFPDLDGIGTTGHLNQILANHPYNLDCDYRGFLIGTLFFPRHATRFTLGCLVASAFIPLVNIVTLGYTVLGVLLGVIFYLTAVTVRLASKSKRWDE